MAWQYSLGSSNGFVEWALTVAELSAAEIAEAERAAAAEAKAAAVSSCRPRRRQAHAQPPPSGTKRCPSGTRRGAALVARPSIAGCMAEYAKSGRSKCKIISDLIAKGGSAFCIGTLHIPISARTAAAAPCCSRAP